VMTRPLASSSKVASSCKADAELLQRVPAMAQQAAGRAVLGVDVAAVLALPGHGQRSRWQGEVQVLCAQQDLGGLGLTGDPTVIPSGQTGRPGPLAADEHGASRRRSCP
jgi:hypothetical protein